MADPFEILDRNRLDMSKAWANYDQGRESSLRDQVYKRKFAADDAATARDTQARTLIGQGAKPEAVVAVDPELGMKYGDWAAKNGDQAHKDAQDRAAAIVNLGGQLKQYPAGDPRRRQLFAQAAPMLKSVGVDDASLAGFNPDDDQAIDAHVGAAKTVMKAGEDYTLGPGSKRFDGSNNVVASVAENPKWQDFDPTHNYVPLNGAAANFGGAPGSSPAGAAPIAPTGAEGGFGHIVAAEGGTNPDGSFRTSPKGAIGPAQLMPGTIPEAAQLAGVDPRLVATDHAANLAAGEAYYKKQLSDFGDPALAAAAYNAGPGRVRAALQQGGPQGWIQHVPAETQAYVQKVMGGGQGQAPAGGYPPGTIMGHPKPKDAPSGYRWKADGTTMEPIPGGPADPGGGASGPAPANVTTLAKALISGQQAMPSSFALGKPFWQQVLTEAYRMDPQFDSSKQPARVAAVKAFTGNGKAAQTIGSVNRIANHLSDMYDASEQLVGPNLGNTGVNSLVAGIGQSFQPTALRTYNTAVPLVADELEKIARNSSGSVHGIEAAIANLKAAQSTDERRAAIQEVVSLIHGAVGPLQTQWSDAFTTGIKPPTWIGSRARGVFAHLAPQLDESDIENPAGSSGGGQSAAKPGGGAAIPPGAVYVGTSQGRPVYKVNGRNWTP